MPVAMRYERPNGETSSPFPLLLIFLAVGTPMRHGDGYADLSYVYQAVETLTPHLDGFTVITTKSTVPVGTSRERSDRGM